MPRRPNLSVNRHFTLGLLILTMSTGCIDAASYLALDRVFTGNMTGNILFIGFGLVGAGSTPLLNNAVALAGFVLGSIIAGRVIDRNAPAGLPRSSRALLFGGAAIILGLGIVWAVVPTLTHVGLVIVTALLAMVMGAQVAAVKPIGNSDVTTIVVTNTLANLARNSRLAGGNSKNWFPRFAAIVAMSVGAAIGAGCVTLVGGAGALLAAAVIFTTGSVVLVWADRRGN